MRESGQPRYHGPTSPEGSGGDRPDPRRALPGGPFAPAKPAPIGRSEAAGDAVSDHRFRHLLRPRIRGALAPEPGIQAVEALHDRRELRLLRLLGLAVRWSETASPAASLRPM